MGRGRRGGVVGLVMAAVVGAAGVPTAAAGQGWIEPPPRVTNSSVTKVRTDVRVRMEGRVALVEVTEWFRNDGARVAEGHYLYPLPGEAVFQGFSLFQGDAELRGEIMDAAQARSIYEEIVRRRPTPRSSNWQDTGCSGRGSFPLPPERSGR